ncbi:Jag N-terminal domain-containing protein [Lactiplantibacillus plantarum]|nr:Jag N-terminal domain-containing protein [Lactiplantibacillus plantarum]
MTVFEGNTVAAAIAAGLKQLHRTRDQVEVEVIAEAKKDFGARQTPRPSTANGGASLRSTCNDANFRYGDSATVSSY